MKKSDYRLSWWLLILLVLTISIGFLPATGQAEEQPAGKTSGSNQTPSIKPGGMSEMFNGTVVEVIDAGRHIYVHIDTGEKRVWVAVPAFDGKPGDKVLVPPGIPVADFHSKNLNRTFEMMYFVGGTRRVDDTK
jgi:TOBE domain